eukprot:s4095_g6.t1
MLWVLTEGQHAGLRGKAETSASLRWSQNLALNLDQPGSGSKGSDHLHTAPQAVELEESSVAAQLRKAAAGNELSSAR